MPQPVRSLKVLLSATLLLAGSASAESYFEYRSQTGDPRYGAQSGRPPPAYYGGYNHPYYPPSGYSGYGKYEQHPQADYPGYHGYNYAPPSYGPYAPRDGDRHWRRPQQRLGPNRDHHGDHDHDRHGNDDPLSQRIPPHHSHGYKPYAHPDGFDGNAQRNGSQMHIAPR